MMTAYGVWFQTRAMEKTSCSAGLCGTIDFNDLVYYNADKHDEYPGDGHLDVEVSRWGYLRKHITWVEGMSDGEWKG